MSAFRSFVQSSLRLSTNIPKSSARSSVCFISHVKTIENTNDYKNDRRSKKINYAALAASAVAAGVGKFFGNTSTNDIVLV